MGGPSIVAHEDNSFLIGEEKLELLPVRKSATGNGSKRSSFGSNYDRSQASTADLGRCVSVRISSSIPSGELPKSHMGPTKGRTHSLASKIGDETTLLQLKEVRLKQ